MSNVVKFPYDACRRVHSKKPRRSKNGSPEERAAKAAATQSPPASIVSLSARNQPPEEPTIDRRKLRGSPLRDKIPLISFAATIVGKICTADLKGEDLPADTAGWREELRTGAATARYVADKLDKAAERLQREAAVMTPKEFGDAYRQASPDVQQFISDKIRAIMAKSETSDIHDEWDAMRTLGDIVDYIATGKVPTNPHGCRFFREAVAPHHHRV
jgi:hypothetical protein